MKRTTIILAGVVLALSGLAWAQAGGETAEQELSRLRAENAALRRQVAALEVQLRAAIAGQRIPAVATSGPASRPAVYPAFPVKWTTGDIGNLTNVEATVKTVIDESSAVAEVLFGYYKDGPQRRAVMTIVTLSGIDTTGWKAGDTRRISGVFQVSARTPTRANNTRYVLTPYPPPATQPAE